MIHANIQKIVARCDFINVEKKHKRKYKGRLPLEKLRKQILKYKGDKKIESFLFVAYYSNISLFESNYLVTYTLHVSKQDLSPFTRPVLKCTNLKWSGRIILRF